MRPRDNFLGTGWGFPVTFTKDNGEQNCTVRMVQEVVDIRESLTILFSTRPGERVMRPDFGGSLEELLFEPVNDSLVTFVNDLIRKAILYYEPRIDLEDININTTEVLEGKLKIDLVFSVRTTNSRFNYVFDYYLQEGTIAPV